MDSITLKNARKQYMWMFVWAGEPNREIEVEIASGKKLVMTYDDLKKLVDCHEITGETE